MDFDLLLEQELAVKAFDYPEETGLLKRGSGATERILNFGTQRHPNTGNVLTYGLDLNTLTAEDAAILLNPEYLTYAWKSKDPIQRRNRLIHIINQNERRLSPKGDGAEEGTGTIGYKLIFKRGPPEHHDKRRLSTPTGNMDVEEPHSSRTSSWKSYDRGKMRDREIIMLDLEPFMNVLNKLHGADKDYTFKNLSDDYLRKASETGKADPIKPDDIIYDEPEEFAKPEIVDTTPVKPAEIDKAKAKEVVEPEVKAEFEPETKLATKEVETEFEPEPRVAVKAKPEVKVEPKLEPPEVKVEPEVKPRPKPEPIEKAIDRRVRREVEAPRPEPEIEPEPELGRAIDRKITREPEPEEIEDNIDVALEEAGLA
jgi:hypothetical protein